MDPDCGVRDAHHSGAASAAALGGRKVSWSNVSSIHLLARVLDDDLPELR
ncbi:hypothetical protein Cus16_2481 [Curtobacterium sp. ER1/6]|nr:hypothetical protein Cus16_2481 [Curtobacterium sp. ER1/6]